MSGTSTGVTVLAEREPRTDHDDIGYRIPGWDTALGVVAGITGRADGDFGLASGTAASEILGRWWRFHEAFQSTFPGLVVSRQVHGIRLAHHAERVGGWRLLDGFDGQVTTVTGMLCVVTVADCIPVYLVAPDRAGVALLHAGWRGIAGGIVEAGVTALAEVTGAGPGDLTLHAGVGISGPCYEVGPETRRALGVETGPTTVDLRQIVTDRARAVGVRRLSVSPRCSHRDPQFHSHRRDGAAAGRMIAYLGIPVT